LSKISYNGSNQANFLQSSVMECPYCLDEYDD